MNIIERLKSLPRDKQLHVAAGFIIGFAVAAVLVVVGVPLPVAVVLGFAAAGVAGWLKERYDRLHPLTHTYDLADFRYTFAAGLPGAALGAFAAFFYLAAQAQGG